MNKTMVTEFILLGFPGSPAIHIIMFLVLLLVFLITLAGNNLMIIVICMDYRLHSPMYIFLVSLSFMEMFGIFTLVPELLTILFFGQATISKAGCITQSFFYFLFCTVDFLLLAVMSYDRYVAICQPLRYSTIMRNTVCFYLVAGCLIASFLCLLYPIMILSQMPFCRRMLDHFFCDGAAMMKLICVDTSLLKLSSLISATFVLNGSLLIIAISYACIIFTIVRLPSKTGRQKTFSTCASHLTMVSIVFGSAIFIEIRPPRNYSLETDKVVNLISSLLGPLLNPFVYTLRNKKVKDCIRDILRSKRILSQ